MKIYWIHFRHWYKKDKEAQFPVTHEKETMICIRENLKEGYEIDCMKVMEV